MSYESSAVVSRPDWNRFMLQLLQERGMTFVQSPPSPNAFPPSLNGGTNVCVTDDIPHHECVHGCYIDLPAFSVFDVKVPVIDWDGNTIGHLQAEHRFTVYDVTSAELMCWPDPMDAWEERTVNTLEAYALMLMLPHYGSFRSWEPAIGFYQVYARDGMIVADTRDYQGNCMHHLARLKPEKGIRHTGGRLIPKVIYVPCEKPKSHDEDTSRPMYTDAEVQQELQRREQVGNAPRQDATASMVARLRRDSRKDTQATPEYRPEEI